MQAPTAERRRSIMSGALDFFCIYFSPDVLGLPLSLQGCQPK
jgi:hypothetical protein